MYAVMLKEDGEMALNNAPILDSPLRYLGNPVLLSGRFTLRSFFLLFEHYPDLKKISTLFPGKPGAGHSDPDQGKRADAEFLELVKTVEMIGFPNPPKLDIYTTLTGVFRSGDIDIKMYNAESLMDIPIRIGKLKHIVFGDQMDEMEFETVFTLFEFIDGILWGLSFLTGPPACTLRH
jgi:hypothetical protein